MSAHTPGPWTVRGLHIVGPVDRRSQHAHGRILIGGVVDDANDWRGHPLGSPIERAEFCDEREANARLIAAAPSLLEALRELYEAEIAIYPNASAGEEAQAAWVMRRSDARDAALAAIAAATGAA